MGGTVAQWHQLFDKTVKGLNHTVSHYLFTIWILLEYVFQFTAVSKAVKSGSTPVGGLVKSGRKRTKEKGRGLDKGLVRPELRPIGFNDKGVEH